MDTDASIRELVCELCRDMYRLGWASGTGGGISIKSGEQIYVAPSGVMKERLGPEDIFVLDSEGQVVAEPGRGLKLSQCTPLFMAAYRQRGAGAVLHSHSIHAMVATLLFGREFRSQNLEMQKGIEGHGAFDTVAVPIIENTAHECDLAGALSDAIRDNPRSNAVLVRGHGVYVWGRDWVHAKTQAECYDYLFDAAARLRRLGIDSAPGPIGGAGGTT
jgi:methylthioribulose-1-phosphate dehydratase